MENSDFYNDVRNRILEINHSVKISTWKNAEEKYVPLFENPNSTLFQDVILAYHLSNVNTDDEIINLTRGILEINDHKIENKLPWYRAMFTIMQNGRYRGSILERHYFDVEESCIEQIVNDVESSDCNNIERDKIYNIITWLKRELGEIPGIRYAIKKERVAPEDKISKIALTSRYLHKPVTYLLKKPSAAEFHYGGLKKKYKI